MTPSSGTASPGPVEGRTADLVAACNAHVDRVVSLDVASGLDATGSSAPGRVVGTDATLTLALPETEPVGVRELWLADIGPPRGVYERLDIDYATPFDGRLPGSARRIRLNRTNRARAAERSRQPRRSRSTPTRPLLSLPAVAPSPAPDESLLYAPLCETLSRPESRSRAAIPLSAKRQAFIEPQTIPT